MTQLQYGRHEAHQAIDEFLADHVPDGRPFCRQIDGDDGEPLAYIVPAAAYHEMEAGHRNWLDSQEVHDDPGLPPGYRPWLHSPLAATERLLPTEPLQEPLARWLFKKPWAELTEPQRHEVVYAAISCLLRVTLDPDGQGAVPVLAAGHDFDEPGPPLRWQLAYVTGVPGLYLRVTGNGFTGEEWGIVTGSGWKVGSGWLSREWAAACCEALGRVLPNCDWMRLTPDGFTPKAKAAVAATIRRYSWLGLRAADPEPEVMTDPVPAAGEHPVAPRPAGETGG